VRKKAGFASADDLQRSELAAESWLRGPPRDETVAIKVYIDGTIHDAGEARVSVFDRGFLYGDSIYEVMRTSGGRPVDLERHLERLHRSAAAIALLPPEQAELRRAIAAVLEAAENEEAYLRVIVTRGAGEIGLDTALATDPKTIIIVRPLQLPPAELYENGIKLKIVGVERTSPRAVDPHAKSGNYLNNIMALHEARRAGAHEAMMCDAGGRIAEGASSNVFAVRNGGVTTPALEIGLLAGITRRRVIELCRDAGIRVVEGELRAEDLRGADEVFITSSIRGVLAVSAVDETTLPAGAPGPLTRRISELYQRHLAAEAAH